MKQTLFCLLALVCLAGCSVMSAQGQRKMAQAQPRRMNQGNGGGQGPGGAQPGRGPNAAVRPNAGAPKGEHLNEWMNAHSNLTPEQQQHALENEPGFRNLPAQTQQRYRDRLNQLNAMDPAKREQMLKRNEEMEKLSPEQRGQVRGAMQQLGALPPDQQHTVARSFNELRRLPADQRAGAMSRLPLNDAQRSTLNNLMRVEPMLPPPAH